MAVNRCCCCGTDFDSNMGPAGCDQLVFCPQCEINRTADIRRIKEREREFWSMQGDPGVQSKHYTSATHYRDNYNDKAKTITFNDFADTI